MANEPWVIQCGAETGGEVLYWSNEIGWVDFSSATHFTQKERETLNLPVEGVWVTA